MLIILRYLEPLYGSQIPTGINVLPNPDEMSLTTYKTHNNLGSTMYIRSTIIWAKLTATYCQPIVKLPPYHGFELFKSKNIELKMQTVTCKHRVLVLSLRTIMP